MMSATVWFESVARKYWLGGVRYWCAKMNIKQLPLLVRKDEHKTVLETSQGSFSFATMCDGRRWRTLFPDKVK